MSVADAVANVAHAEGLLRERRLAVAKEIAELRAATGMTTRAFASRIGVSAPHVTELEKGRRYPSPKLIERLNQVHDVVVVRGCA